MFNIKKDIKNNDGIIETILIISNDKYNSLDINQKYKLVNYTSKRENKIVNSFKNSILGAEIGVKTEGFSTITIIATLVAIGALCIMYAFWKI